MKLGTAFEFGLTRSFLIVLMSLCALAYAGPAANAVLVTGNPSTDSWVFSSNNLNNGSYIQGAANFGFDLYSASFLADSTLAGAAGGGWLNGHSILAVGGKRQSTDGVTAGWGSAFSGGAVNGELTGSARVVVKFGTTVSNEVATSTNKPASGNGVGSFSGGNLGDGSVLLGTLNTGSFTSGNQNLLLTLSTNQRAVGTTSSPTVSNISSDFGRVIYKLGTDGLLDTWEVLLNKSLLTTAFPTGPAPMEGTRSVVTIQHGSGNVTDALISISAVPEPGAVLFGGLAVCVAGAAFVGNRLKGKWFARRQN
jgi:hypothetical protein